MIINGPRKTRRNPILVHIDLNGSLGFFFKKRGKKVNGVQANVGINKYGFGIRYNTGDLLDTTLRRIRAGSSAAPGSRGVSDGGDKTKKGRLLDNNAIRLKI